MEYEKILSKFTDISTSKYNIEFKNLKEVISTLSKTQYRVWKNYGFDINHQFDVIYSNKFDVIYSNNYNSIGIKILQSLLHLAIQTNSTKLAKYLLDRNANINILNQNGHSPITYALFFLPILDIC